MINNIEGMTVNERLYHFNLIEDFDKAIQHKDIAKAIEILIKTKFTKKQSEETVTALLKTSK